MENKEKIDLNMMVAAAVDNVLKSTKMKIAEAYVAQPKPFKQVSELVSQKTKSIHTELYDAYVKTLNQVSVELDTTDRTVANSLHSAFKSNKQDETFNLNAVWLHELYFANCFDPHSEVAMNTLAYMRLERDFGTFDDWQRDFIACATSASEGWAVCGWHSFLGRYVNTVINGHCDNVMIGLHPVIVVDTWSHAYVRDYGTDKVSYTIAMMREFNWTVIEDRFKKCDAMAKVSK